MGNRFLRLFVILISFLLFSAAASEDERIKYELSSQIVLIPLEKAMGKEAYADAIGSGKYHYVGNSKCRLCHRKFFIGRKKDPHDHAMDSLLEDGYENNERCLNCHSTGFGTPTGFVSIKKTPRLSNVQCEGCHGPGNIHIKMAKDKKQNEIRKFVHGGFLAGEDNSDILKKMCVACHTERWNKSYHDLDKAYDNYKKANPNSRKRTR